MKWLFLKKDLFKAIGYSLITLVVIGLCIYVIYFMYNNVYKTFVYTDEVLSINTDQEINVLNIEEFNNIKSSLGEKKEKRRLDIFMDFE